MLIISITNTLPTAGGYGGTNGEDVSSDCSGYSPLQLQWKGDTSRRPSQSNLRVEQHFSTFPIADLHLQEDQAILS